MRPFARLALLGTILALPLAAHAETEAVAPGKAAPGLLVKSWYKGEPVTAFAPGKTYVVEFWATWCGPCKDSIPHLTEMAKANPDVTFVGVSIWEEDKGGNVKKFVDEMGDKMDYHVGYSGNQDGMASTWMRASGQNGIPTAFVVKDEKILWVGHPMEMEGPLAKIKAGTFDLAAFKVEFNKRAAANRAEMAAYKAITAAEAQFKAGKRTEAKAALAAVVKKYPSQTDSVERTRFTWLAIEDPAAWLARAKAIAASKNAMKIDRLGGFAMRRAKEPGGATQARQAIGLALDATGHKEFDILWYATEVYAATKDDALALDATNAMLAMFDTSSAKDSKEFKDKLLQDKAMLEARLAAVAKGG